MRLQVGHNVDGPAHVVRVRGELDVFTARGLEEALQKSYGKDAGRVIVDLSQCRYIDSSVVAVLIRARKEIICELFVVVQEHSAARRVLDITHVDQLVRIASTLEEAQSECCLD